MVKPISDKTIILVKLGNGKRDRGAEILKMLKQAGPQIGAVTLGKNSNADKLDKTVQLVKW